MLERANPVQNCLVQTVREMNSYGCHYLEEQRQDGPGWEKNPDYRRYYHLVRQSDYHHHKGVASIVTKDHCSTPGMETDQQRTIVYKPEIQLKICQTV